MKKIFAVSTIILLSIIFSKSTSAFSRPEDHVISKGKIFKEIRNAHIDKIRVYAVKKGKLQPIPFQIDKVNLEEEYILDIEREMEKAKERMEAYEDALDNDDISKTKLAELKRNAHWVEDMKIFDAQDELVFMAWELGKEATANMFPKAAKIEKITVTNPVDSNTAYAYIALFETNPPPLSPVKYIQYDPKDDKIIGKTYYVNFDDELPVVVLEADVNKADGTIDGDLMDRFKIRLKMDIKWFVTINFDENNIDGKIVAYKVGPVRLIRRLEVWIELLYIQVSPTARVDYVFYPNGLITPIQLDMPFEPKSLLNEESSFWAGFDFNKGIIGSKVYTNTTPEPVILDGEISNIEKALNLKNQNWFVLYRDEGEKGVFAQMANDKRFSSMNLVNDILYLDDKTLNIEPENIPGQLMVGFTLGMLQFPKGKSNMYVYMYMDRKWYRGMEKRFLNFIDKPLKTKATKIK